MWSWQRRIDRANELARADGSASAVLTQYAGILAAQAACSDALVTRGERLTGALEADLAELRPRAAAMFDAIAPVAPAHVMRDAPADASAIDSLLVDGWREWSIPFLARVVLQPYAEALAVIAGSARSRDPVANLRAARNLHNPAERAACPFCGGPPQVSVVRAGSTADGGSRALICATCATAWPVRRILCVSCGEADERRLGYFSAAQFDHARIDTCETCRHYVKSIDLTRLGLAVPVVDDVASGALDIWAHERGYEKVTPNLIGI